MILTGHLLETYNEMYKFSIKVLQTKMEYLASFNPIAIQALKEEISKVFKIENSTGVFDKILIIKYIIEKKKKIEKYKLKKRKGKLCQKKYKKN